MDDFRYFHYKPGAENWVEPQSSFLSIASSNPIYIGPDSHFWDFLKPKHSEITIQITALHSIRFERESNANLVKNNNNWSP